MMMTRAIVVPSGSPRRPTKQQKMLSMEIKTNLKLVQLPNALRHVAIVEVFDFDKKDSRITVVPRGTNPPYGPNAILIELLHSSEDNKNDTLGDC